MQYVYVGLIAIFVAGLLVHKHFAVFSCIHRQAPKRFFNYFRKINEVVQRTTRQSRNKLNLYFYDTPSTDYRDALSIRESRFEISFQNH